jgi:hypothetical protein
MKAIYYKDGVYVLIESDNHKNTVYDNKVNKHVSLFGGRVEIRWYIGDEAIIKVDGIKIEEINQFSTKATIPLGKITSYLNAIEANGVDAFIENYKKSVELVYAELKDLSKETDFHLSSGTGNNKIESLLDQIEKIRNLLISVLGILFSLQTYMNAGLENEKVIAVAQSVIDLLD